MLTPFTRHTCPMDVLKLVHDLKSPLSALKIILARGGQAEDEGTHLLQATVKNIENLIASCIGEDALCKSKIEEEDLKEICLQIVAESLLISQGYVVLIWNLNPVAVTITPLNIYRLLSNLMSNAVEATGGREDIELSVFNTKSDLILEVTNPRSTPGTLKNKGGWGLGLLIVREIVAQQNGTLDIACDAHQVCVRITIPITD